MTRSQEKRASHTPGPWHWHKCLTRQHLHNEAGSCFAQVSMPSPHNMPIADAPQYRANAALIAAAPEMFVALQAAQKRLEQFDDNSTEGIAIRIVVGSALAKAVQS